MVRIYDDMMGKILTALTYLRADKGNQRLYDIGTQTMELGPVRWGQGDGLEPNTVDEISIWARSNKDRTSLDELINQIAQVMYERRSRTQRGEKTLIDTIVETLQLDTAAAILGGRALRRLREAILLPSEQAPLVKHLRTRTMSCSNCSRDIHHGEACSGWADENGQMHMYCYNCQRPRSVRCAAPECNEQVGVTAKTRFIQEFYCHDHRGKAPAEGANPTVIPAGGRRNAAATLDPWRTIMGRIDAAARDRERLQLEAIAEANRRIREADIATQAAFDIETPLIAFEGEPNEG